MARPSRLASSLSSLVAAAALATPLTAQCEFDWLPGPGARGPYGTVPAILELPNGDLVAGGQFAIADSAFINNIARWDGTTWQPLGSGIWGYSSNVYALAMLPNGDLVAGGLFSSAGGQAVNNIARWDGSSWTPLGPGLDGTVFALLVLPNGDLVVGGWFHNAGATTTHSVARWDGVSWSPLGNGFPSFDVRALARMPNGDIIAGGYILQGSTYYGLQRWDGVLWQPVPGLDPATSSTTASIVSKVAVHPNGDLLATGRFFINGLQTGAVRWNGVAMQSLNPPISIGGALIARATGDVLIGPGSSWETGLYRWNGAGWTPVAGGPPRAVGFAEDSNGALLVGAWPPSPNAPSVTRFDGVSWQTIGGPTPPDVRAMVRMWNGDVVVGGSFASFGGVAANNLARWNGSVWSPLGSGVDGSVSALAPAPNGDLVVSGSFANAGGAPANRVARWNGQVWSPLAGGLSFAASDLAAGANGDVLAIGGGLMRFDGLTWGPLALPPGLIAVAALASLPNGNMAIGGFAPGTGASVALVSSGTITPLPGALNQVRQLLADSRGGLVASDGITTQRWDGTTWTQLPIIFPGFGPSSLDELPNGDLIACGAFLYLGGGAQSSIYRLRSSGWESFGNVRALVSPMLFVTASGRGEVFVAGAVQSAGSVVSIGFAHGQPTCPAAVSSVGAGCAGAAGPMTLGANNAPWVGSVFTATASSMLTNSLAVQVFGSAAPALPLPASAPGCSLFVAPIVMDLLLPSGGTATSTWAIPALPSLAGLQLRLQVVGIELTATGIVLTSTNALDLTIGML